LDGFKEFEMKRLLSFSSLASTGVMMALVGGFFLGLNQRGTRLQASYDRVKVYRKTPIDSMNCMSGPWNDCAADVKRAGWSKGYKRKK
jgi:hypothetical protein